MRICFAELPPPFWRKTSEVFQSARESIVSLLRETAEAYSDKPSYWLAVSLLLGKKEDSFREAKKFHLIFGRSCDDDRPKAVVRS